MMWQDPIVAEVHQWREAHAARLNYDLGAMLKDIRQQRAQPGWPHLSSEKNQNSNHGTRYETSPTTKGARATPLPLWNPPSSCPRSKLRGVFRISYFA